MNPRMLSFGQDAWKGPLCFAGAPFEKKKQMKPKLEVQRVDPAATPQNSNKWSKTGVARPPFKSRIREKQLKSISNALIKKFVSASEPAKEKNAAFSCSQAQQEHLDGPPSMKEFTDFRGKLNEQAQRTNIQEAFQRTCQGLQAQASSEFGEEAGEEAQTAHQESPTNQSQLVGEASNLFQQFLKPAAKKRCDVISLSSDSDGSSKINFQVQRPQVSCLPQQQRRQDALFNIPPLKLKLPPADPAKLPLLSSNYSLKEKFGLNYQSPPPYLAQKTGRNAGNYAVSGREGTTRPKGALSKAQKPQLSQQNFNSLRSPSPQQSPYEQEEYQPQFFDSQQASPAGRWNVSTIAASGGRKQAEARPDYAPALKFAARAPSPPAAELPLKETNFYVHIDLLPAHQVHLPSRQASNQSAQEENNRHRGNPWAPSLPSKYRLTNSSRKYKQERIENYFGLEERPPCARREAEEGERGAKEPPQSGCRAKRSWKYPAVNHQLAMQGELQLQNLSCSQFLERRRQRRDEPRDVGVLSLDELVEQCFTREVLSQEVYVEYVKRTSREKVLQFVRLFLEGRTEEWDYDALKITLMDHRRLAEVLVKAFPCDYALYQPLALQREVNDFLANLYLLTSSDHAALLDTLDAASGVDFWKTFKVRFQEHLEAPLLILPYKPRQHAEEPDSERWAEASCPQAAYTPTEIKLMQNYRTTREKIKETCPKAVYTNEESSDSCSSDSSELSSELSYHPAPPPSAKPSVKKSGKGRPAVRRA